MGPNKDEFTSEREGERALRNAEAKEPPKASKPRGSKRGKEAKAPLPDAKRAKGTAEARAKGFFLLWARSPQEHIGPVGRHSKPGAGRIRREDPQAVKASPDPESSCLV